MCQKIQMKCLAAILMLALSATTQAETPVVEWTRQLGTSSNDYGHGVSVDGSGNAYVTGWTYGGLDGSTNAGRIDIFLTKYDTAGIKLWTRQWGSVGHDIGHGVSVDGSGNAYVTGYTTGGLDGNTSEGDWDIFLTKYNTAGTKLWTRQLGTRSNEYGYDVSVDGSGNAYVTGYTEDGLDGNTHSGASDIFLAKYDTDGTKLWTQQLGTARRDHARNVSVDGSGNAYLTGGTTGGLDGNTSEGDWDIFLTKYNTVGTKLWTRQLGSDESDSGYGVSVDGSGNVYVTGYTEGALDGNTSAGSYDMFLIKYNSDGAKLWTQQLGTASDDGGSDVSIDGNDNVYVAGRTEGCLDGNSSEGDCDIFLTKYDRNGTKLWTKQLGSDEWDSGLEVSVDGRGNAYITGLTYGSLGDNTNAGGEDMFLVKISTIPEPGSIAMLAVIALTTLLYRKRKQV